MQPDKDSSAEDRSRARGSAKKENIENIVNELRNVLSGLGKEPPRDADPKPQDVSGETPVPDPFPASFSNDALRLTDTPFHPNGTASPTPGAAEPNDNDFWNGNVLGWSPADG